MNEDELQIAFDSWWVENGVKFSVPVLEEALKELSLKSAAWADARARRECAEICENEGLAEECVDAILATIKDPAP